MQTTYRNNARGGHCPGHVRDTFLAALEAYRDWKDGEPEPTVDFEVNYEPRPIPISKAAGLVWNCSDILPRDAVEDCEYTDLMIGRRTYASAARAMVAAIRAEPIAA
jgi:hypothetical protein